MNYREVAKELTAKGCKMVRQGKGSHMFWYSPLTDQRFPIQNHGGKDIPRGTLKAIEKQSGVRLL